MSCCGEWVRPMEHTIISCQGRLSTAQAQYLPGPCRKGPDNDLQTTTMRRETGIIPGSSGNNIYSCLLVFISQFLPSCPDSDISHTSFVYVMLWWVFFCSKLFWNLLKVNYLSGEYNQSNTTEVMTIVTNKLHLWRTVAENVHMQFIYQFLEVKSCDLLIFLDDFRVLMTENWFYK